MSKQWRALLGIESTQPPKSHRLDSVPLKTPGFNLPLHSSGHQILLIIITLMLLFCFIITLNECIYCYIYNFSHDTILCNIDEKEKTSEIQTEGI
jgi:hypothetical protein